MVTAHHVHFVKLGMDLPNDFVDRILVGVLSPTLAAKSQNLQDKTQTLVGFDMHVEREIHAVAGQAAGRRIGDAAQTMTSRVARQVSPSCSDRRWPRWDFSQIGPRPGPEIE